MSGEMNPWLAQMYNTNGAAEEATEEQTKLANADLFCKLAADNNIDLRALSSEEVGMLYAQTFPEDIEKYAQETCEKCEKAKGECECGSEDEKDEEKTSAAMAYHQEKLAEVDKYAEADMMGRIMAHSFTQELEQIKEAASVREVAGKGVDIAKRVGGRISKAVKSVPKQFREGGEMVAEGKRILTDPNKKRHPGLISGAKREAAQWTRMGRGEQAKAVGKAAVPVAALGAAGAVGVKKLKGKDKEKKGSAEAFEEFSANHAIKVAEAMDWDVDEAYERISAVYTLGLQETEKVAHVQDTDDAIHVRGLEYLEAAGYPVDWNEVFGEE